LRDLLANIIGDGELGLLVYVAAPISGGHMNPLISIAAFLAGLSSFPRAVVYVIFQLLGATIGAFLVRAIYGKRLPEKVTSRISHYTVFNTETSYWFIFSVVVMLIRQWSHPFKHTFLKRRAALPCCFFSSASALIHTRSTPMDQPIPLSLSLYLSGL
jgi:glycerol uptake facilitator-like aquaporin